MKRSFEILLVITCLLLGGLLNQQIIDIQSYFIPLPPGVDFSSEVGITIDETAFSETFLIPLFGTCIGHPIEWFPGLSISKKLR